MRYIVEKEFDMHLTVKPAFTGTPYQPGPDSTQTAPGTTGRPVTSHQSPVTGHRK